MTLIQCFVYYKQSQPKGSNLLTLFIFFDFICAAHQSRGLILEFALYIAQLNLFAIINKASVFLWG